VLTGVLLSACQLRRPTPIGDVLENPAAFEEVVVSGTVTDRAGILGWSAYVLRDATGEVKVLTQRVLPRIGDRVRVACRVRNVVVMGSFQAIVLVETKRLSPPVATVQNTALRAGTRRACQILAGQAFSCI
jgi:hypothetical protein